MNLDSYPEDVTITGVDLSPAMLEHARRRAAGSGRKVTLQVGDAHELKFPDASFDTVVCTFSLCAIPDERRAIAEMWRVLRPGGQLRFFEHVRAGTRGLARVQRVLDATVWPTFGGGCHTDRDTRAAIEAAGFTIDEMREFRIPDSGIPAPASPHILGTASIPDAR